MKIKWISVKDRLPKEWTPVLCWDGISYFVGVHKRGKFHDDNYLEREAIHWMPLPDPPEEKSKEDEN